MAAFVRFARGSLVPLVVCWLVLVPSGAFAAAEAEHGSGHHDPHDLSTANASAALEDPSEWRYDMSLCTFVVFLLLLGLLWWFAWGPIMDGLDSREQFIASQIESAKQSADKAAEELRAYQAKLASAAQDAAAIVAQARKDAESVAEKIHAEAQADATRERDRAIAEIQAAKHAALRDVARRGTDLAVSLAGRIVRRELRPADHVALITEALEQFPSAN